MIAFELISDSITYVNPGHSGERCLALMNVFQVKNLPVIDDDYHLLGIISDDDILVRNFNDPIQSYQLELTEVHVRPDQHIFDIIHLLSKHDISLIPVVEDDKYIGSVRKQDVISFLGNAYSFSQPGSIIELWIQKRNYSPAEISRIVESENAKIISLFISDSAEDRSGFKVIIKIDKDDISKIIASFERFDYEIKASFTEQNDYDELLKERFDSLMHYLNV